MKFWICFLCGHPNFDPDTICIKCGCISKSNPRNIHRESKEK